MLIKCVECGHDVSEHAQACPNCGCPVSLSLKFPEPKIEDSDQLEELQEKLNEIEQQLEQVEDSDQLEELTSGENENPDSGSEVEEEIKPDKTLRKVAIWSVLLAAFILVPFIIENKTQKDIGEAKLRISRIENDLDDIKTTLNNADCVVYSKEYADTVSDIERMIMEIAAEKISLQIKYEDSKKISQAIDTYLIQNGETWDEFIYRLEYGEYGYVYNGKIDANERAKELVKAVSYQSVAEQQKAQEKALEEQRKEKRSKSLIVESFDYDYSYGKEDIIITGTVKNNLSRTVYFVQVKTYICDSSENVIDTGWTYAVGSEGLSPGESSKFTCYLDYDSRFKFYGAKIYDYSY